MQDINIKELEIKILDIKKQIDELKPFNKDQLLNLKKWFKISFTRESNAIEWNSYTLSEVKILVEDWITIWWKTVKETKETENLAFLTDKIWEFFDKDFYLDETFILDLHKSLLKDIEIKNLGKYRDIQVFISWSEDIPPKAKEIHELMIKFIADSNETHINILEKIAKVHYDFVKIHPFTDWNWRIARLLMNLYFIKYGFLPIIFPVITRIDYINSLWKDKKFEDFYRYFLWQTYENQKDYLRLFHN